MTVNDAPSAHRASALVPALLGVFLLAMTLAIQFASFEDGWIVAMFVRAFAALVMGGIAIGLLVVAARVALGHADASPALPVVVRALCPACGAHGVEHAASCVRCLHPRLEDASRWTTEHTSVGMIAFMGALGAGIGSLGVVCAVGPLVDGIDWLPALGMGALGLLLLSVGLAFCSGAVLLLRDAIRGKQVWRYEWNVRMSGHSVYMRASAVVRARVLVSAEGQRGSLSLPSATPGAHATLLVESQRPFLLGLLALWDAGLVGLVAKETAGWCLGGPATSTPGRHEIVVLKIEGVIPRELGAVYDVLVPRTVDREGIELSALWRSVRDDAAAGHALGEWARSVPGTRALESSLAAALARVIAPRLAN